MDRTGLSQNQGQGLRQRHIGQQSTPRIQQATRSDYSLAAAAVGAVTQMPELSLPTLAFAASVNIALAAASSTIPSASSQGQQAFVSAIPPNATNVFDNISRVVGSAALATLAPSLLEIVGIPAAVTASVTYGALTLGQVVDAAMKIRAARNVAATT